MKNFYFVLLVACFACSEPYRPDSTRNAVSLDVVHSYKKQFACKLVEETFRYESKFDDEEGHFKTQQIVVPEHTECYEVEVSVCGTLTEL